MGRRLQNQQCYSFFDTAIGRCAVSWSEQGITAVQLPERTPDETLARLTDRFRGVRFFEAKPPVVVREAVKLLTKSLNGDRADLSAIAVDMEALPPFHRAVYKAARRIPAGCTVSYGQLADAAGSPAAARAVGQAMARNPLPLIIPCHRVIGHDGSPGGFSAFGGCDLKNKLLKLEGVSLSGQTDMQPQEVRSRRERKFDSRTKTEPATAGEAPSMRFAPGKRSQLKFDPDEAIEALSARDKRLGKLIGRVGHFSLELDEMLTPFEALAESIVYQQLTGKAAATIFSRVKQIYGGGRLPAPEKIIKTPDEKLRAAGLSMSKTLALKDLARKQADGQIPSVAQLERMSDEEIIECLTAVRGVGRWTVEMLLIFRLGRPDVLPINDYGVRKGFAVTFNKSKEELPTPKELEAYGEKWRPFRSVASWYMWRALEL